MENSLETWRQENSYIHEIKWPWATDSNFIRNTSRTSVSDIPETTFNNQLYSYYTTLSHFYSPIEAINHATCNNIKPKIEENSFLAIEQLDLVLIPMLQNLGSRIPNVYMAVLWNPGGQTAILKRNTTISYVKRIRLYGKSLPDQWGKVGKIIPTPSFYTVREVTRISHEKLPLMPETSAFTFHYKSYPEQKLT